MSDIYCVGAPVPGGEARPMADDEELARAFHALAHPARLKLVRLLAASNSCTGSEVFSALNLAQSTISEHLRVLSDAGLVKSTPNGTRNCYCLVPERLEALSASMHALTD